MVRLNPTAFVVVFVSYLLMAIRLPGQATFSATDMLVPTGGAMLHAQVVANVVGSPADDLIVGKVSGGVPSLAIFDADAGVWVATLQTSAIVRSLVAADLDGDGNTDLAGRTDTFSQNPANVSTVVIWLNVGGSAPSASSVPLPLTIGSPPIAARDMDDDGDIDLVTGAVILWNDGAGGFSAQTTVDVGTLGSSWAPGDFDGDGDVDLMTVYYDGPWSTLGRILQRDANGSFTLLAPFTIPAPFVFPPSIVSATLEEFQFGDMNGDGTDDLVVSLRGLWYGSVQTLLGGPGFTFSAVSGFFLQSRAIIGRFAIADLDNDGDSDVSLRSSDTPVLLLNDGTGALAPATGRLFAGLTPTSGTGLPIGVGDLDGDGDADLATQTTPATGSAALLRLLLLDGSQPQPTLIFDPIPIATPHAGSVIPAQYTGPWGLGPTIRLADQTPALGQVIAVDDPSFPIPTGIDSHIVATGDGFAPITILVGPSSPPQVIDFTASTGATATLTLNPIPLLTKILGDGQSAQQNGTWTSALGVHSVYTTGAIHWSISPGGLSALSSSSQNVNANGDAYYSLGPPTTVGVYTVTASTVPLYWQPESWQMVTFTVTVTVPLNGVVAPASGTPPPAGLLSPAPEALTKILGDGQIVAQNGAWTDALGVHRNSNLGSPNQVFWAISPAGLGMIGTFGATSVNANGDSFLLLGPPTTPGVYTVYASAAPISPWMPNWFTVEFTVTVVAPGTMVVQSGASQATALGSTFAAPVVVRRQNQSGAPEPGIPITFTVTQGGAVLSASTVVTGSNGEATVTVTPTEGGAISISASSVNAPTLAIPVFCRALEYESTAAGPTITYRHEHAQTPITLMIDVPLPPPGHLTTALGELYTSILSPTSTTSVLDGVGWLGPVDPQLITDQNGIFARTFGGLIPPGIVWVAQVVSYDVAYPWPSSAALSNAVSFVF